MIKTPYRLILKNACRALSCLLLLLISTQSINGQQAQWIIKNLTESNSKIIDFRDGPPLVNPMPITIDDYYYERKEGDNAVYDEDGNLSLFVVHNQAFLGDGTEINLLVDHTSNPFQDLGGSILYDHTFSIVRVPKSCDQYYLIRHSWQSSSGLSKNWIHYFTYDTNLEAFIKESGEAYEYVDFATGNLIYWTISEGDGGQVDARHLAVTPINSSST